MKHLIVAAALLGVSLTSQAGEQVGLRDLVASNYERLQKLEQGMSRAQVVETMKDYVARTSSGIVANPYRTETFARAGATYEVLYYLTQRPQYTFDVSGERTQTSEVPTTPVILRDGVVSGWGQMALRSLLRGAVGGVTVER